MEMLQVIRIIFVISIILIWLWSFYTILNESSKGGFKKEKKMFVPLSFWFTITLLLFLALVVSVFRSDECIQYEIVHETLYRIKQ